MKKIYAIGLWALALTTHAQNQELVNNFADSLQALANREQSVQRNYSVSPYYYQMLYPSTYYSDVTRNVFSLDSTQQSAINFELLKYYANNPAAIAHHDGEFQKENLVETAKPSEISVEAEIKKEINEAITANAAGAKAADDDIDIEMKVARPNFWKSTGTLSLKFTQNYFSDNWYQGGNNNGTMMATINASLTYNDTKKITWENKLDIRLGFITTTSDTCHSFLTNTDKFQFNSKFNLKAVKNWNYTVSGEAKTQLMPGYRSNNKNKFSDFISPLDVSLSVGMDYKPQMKNKQNSLSLEMLPLSYKLRYIGSSDENIHKNYRFINRSTQQDYGSRLNFNCKFNLCKNVIWKCRSYCFTSYEYVEAELENIFTFEFSKYISTDLYTLWRFDDNRPMKYNDEHLGYFQFKEYITLGLQYKF